MIDVNIDGLAPEHVERLLPNISVDEAGKISWVPGFTDYNPNLYPRGHQVKSEEFNEAILKSVYQGNYLTDSLNILLNEHLNTAIARTFKNTYNLVPSYIKVFGTEDWGTQQEDGYYYITIPATEHGFLIDEVEATVDRMNIDTEMYLLDSNGHFYEVRQVTINTENTVQIYTDDNTLIGFIVIRTNDKSYALAETLIDATQILGLAEVATSAKYTDLVDLTNPEGTGPDDRINRNTKNINAIILGKDIADNEVRVAKATDAITAETAEYASSLLASGKIQNINVTDIFEIASSYVKNATSATTAIKAINADIHSLDTADDTISFQIGEGIVYNKTINNVANAIQATNDSEGNSIIDTYAKLTAFDTFKQEVTQQLEDKMGNYILVASPNTASYDRAKQVLADYNFVTIVFEGPYAASNKTIKRVLKDIPKSALEISGTGSYNTGVEIGEFYITDVSNGMEGPTKKTYARFYNSGLYITVLNTPTSGGANSWGFLTTEQVKIKEIWARK